MSDPKVGDFVWCIGQDSESEMYGRDWPVYPFKAKLVGITGRSAELEIHIVLDGFDDEKASYFCDSSALFFTEESAIEAWRLAAKDYASELGMRAGAWFRAARTGIPIDGIRNSF